MADAAAPLELRIRAAAPDDVPTLLALIRELADYERLEVTATEEMLRDCLFGSRPAAEALLAEIDGVAVGYAVYFVTCSTFAGHAGIYLEDLYIQPIHRGLGYGHQLLAHVARVAVERGCSRLVWAVLDWNQPAIDFYEELGAQRISGWHQYRLTGPELARLASS